MDSVFSMRCTAAVAMALVCCSAIRAQSVGARASSGSVVSSGSGASATFSSVSVTMQVGTTMTLAVGQQFEYEYLDSTGAPLPVDKGKVTADSKGKITILVPAVRGHMGAAIRICWPGPGCDITTNFYTTIKLNADNGGMFSKPGPVTLVLNGPGVPPGNGPQDWHIQLPPAVLDSVEFRFAAGGTQGVVASNLSLGYTAFGVGQFDVFIHGTDNSIELESGDILFFSDLQPVGTLDFSAGMQSGRFDFTLFGLAGLWSMDGFTGQVSAVSVAPGSAVFNRLQLVPEPGTGALVLLALGLAVPGLRGRGTARGRPAAGHPSHHAAGSQRCAAFRMSLKVLLGRITGATFSGSGR